MVRFARAHARIQMGGGGSLKNHKNIGFLTNTGPDPLKSYKAARPAFNVEPASETPAKRHVNDVSLAGR